MSNLLVKSPPANSNIEVRNEFNQTIILWKNPRGSWTKYFGAIFLLAWLGGWTMGEYSVIKQLLNGTANPFLIFWLIGWTVGGGFAIANIYFLLRPSKPESLIFDSYSLQFKRGTPPFARFNWNRNKQGDDDETSIWRKTKNKYTIPRTDTGEIKLERVGERQRLTIDYGVERIEIGRFLEEPEREWLFQILKQWKGNL